MARGWTFPVALDAAARVPLFHQIARAIAADVGRGRLRPGDRLPGSRALAATLAVHRSTVVTAYAELVAQGWATTRAAGATLIAASSPEFSGTPAGRTRKRRLGPPAQAGFAVGPLPSAQFRAPAARDRRPGVVALWGGVPDLRLLPMVQLGRALRRVAKLSGASLLAYSPDRAGQPRLRVQLARMLSAARGLAIGADDLVVTQGSQMALDLTARTLVQPGDLVAVEAIGYRSAWAALQRAGAELVPIPVDGEGIDVAALGRLLEASRSGRAGRSGQVVRAVHVTPQHQYPSTVVLSPRRRTDLLALAQQHRLAIIEDDYDYEYHYDGRPVLPLASADPGGHVIYVGSLAKILAPGLRIGFVVAARNFLARLTNERILVDGQGNHLIEAAVAELLEDGEIERHARRVRRIYQQRRDLFCAALDRHLGAALDVPIPRGGMALWAKAAPGIDADLWHARAAHAGLLYQSGTSLAFDGRPLAFLRLGFACCNESELEIAARRLAASLPRTRSAAW